MTERRPLIGLTGRRRPGRDLERFPRSLADVQLNVYVAEYARAVIEAGGLPVHLPLDVDPADYVGRLDGLLLSGGEDVEPALYGALPETDIYPPDPLRDRVELGFVDMAIADEMPVLGICRGLQLLNVWGGGTLHQHVPTHARYDVPPADRIDELSVERGTLLHELYGDQHVVNSLHHQTVDRVADGWIVAARSGDGTVEGIEWPGHDVLAVQWHPELLPTRPTDPVFAWLVQRAGAAQRVGR